MRSRRLRGHTLDGARERLVGGGSDGSPATNNIISPEPAEPATIPTVQLDDGPKDGAGQQHRRLGWWAKLSRRQQWLAGTVAAIVLAGGGTGLFLVMHKQPEPIPQPAIIVKPVEPPKPATAASPLTGMQVSPKLAKRPVTAVMIENSLDARPQSGLQDAGVVFEAIAEGGITRFIALFQESTPQYIGPVRSVRPYFLDWAYPFNASIAHVGGSPQGLAEVRGGMRDIDQFFNPGSYWRTSTRYPPHNMYTSFAKLDALNKAKGHKSSKFTPWERKDEAPLKVPKVKSIDLAISSYYYNVHYAYNAKTNSYYRSEGGKPHVNLRSAKDKTGRQLHPKVVVVMVMPYGFYPDGYHSKYGDTGSGRAYIFQDGGITKGLWKKTSRGSQLKFITSGGTPIKLNAGQTWVTTLSATNQLSYK